MLFQEKGGGIIMGIPVLIIGESGSGKSTSLRNFNAEEVGIFNIAGKPLPFKKTLPKIDGATYKKITKALKNPTKKTYVIDDSQYLIAFDSFENAKVKGYDKFTDMAINFKDLIMTIISDTPNDIIVYFLHHTETKDGKIKAKTIGQMLDNQLTVEGLFSIVLMAYNKDGKYTFLTHSDGQSTVKSPMEMFEEDEIDNDLTIVDKAIRDYWSL